MIWQMCVGAVWLNRLGAEFRDEKKRTGPYVTLVDLAQPKLFTAEGQRIRSKFLRWSFGGIAAALLLGFLV